jgi:hypothetical protein
MTFVSAGIAQAAEDVPQTPARSEIARVPQIDASGSCYQQLQRPAATSVISQRFEPDFSAFDSRGADDFLLSASCTARSVDVYGTYFDNPGPADSESIVIFADMGGQPGRALTRQTVVGEDTSGMGSFHLRLNAPVRLKPGSYWLSIRINMAYGRGGIWGWDLTQELHGARALWKNPGDGFASGCTTYQDMQTCLGESATGPDFMFAVNSTR